MSDTQRCEPPNLVVEGCTVHNTVTLDLALVRALVEALDFYACVDHYPVHHAVAPEVVRNDGGGKARAALALYRGEVA